MSANTAELAIHLPYLRRFARALTGSQETGDSYAMAGLEAAVAADPPLSGAQDVRIWLFAALLKVWSSIAERHVETPADVPEGIPAPKCNLRAITPLPRAAFLLKSVEGLGIERVAAALRRSIPETRALLDQARQELAAQITTDVLIIEDEPIIAMSLQAIVEELGHLAVHTARTYREAIEAVGQHSLGLVLADVHLADGSSGLDAVNEIIATYEVPVVFITAYPEQVLTGTRPEPTFLIAKPFRAETVKVVVSQTLFFDVRAHRGRTHRGSDNRSATLQSHTAAMSDRPERGPAEIPEERPVETSQPPPDPGLDHPPSEAPPRPPTKDRSQRDSVSGVTSLLSKIWRPPLLRQNCRGSSPT